MKLFMVFGNQLFPEVEFKKYKNDHVFFMCESMQMCSKFNYHKKKLLFMRIKELEIQFNFQNFYFI